MKKYRNLRQNKVWVVFFVINILLIIIGLFFYNNFLRKNLLEQNYNMLEEVMLQQMFNFDLKLNNDMKTMRALADLIAKLPNNKEIIQQSLRQLVQDTDFEYLTYGTLDGNSFNNDGTFLNISDRAYFKEVMKGKTVISDPIESKLRQSSVIVVATPLYRNGKIDGILSGSYMQKQLNQLFLPSFNGTGYAYVTTNSGDIIAKTTNSFSLTKIGNIFDDWKNADFYLYDDLATIRKNLEHGISGNSRYQINGQKRYLHYKKIPVNNWNIFTIVPEQMVAHYTNIILISSAILTFSTAFLFLALILFIYSSQKRYTKTLAKMAFTDELTGISNLVKFKIDSQNIIEKNQQNMYVIVKFDIEAFKLINDSMGFEFGDKVLKSVAKALAKNITESDETFARVNSDEFVMLLKFESYEQLAKKRESFKKSVFDLLGEDFEFSIKFPTGQYVIRSAEEEKKDGFSMFEKANFAHRKAKASVDEKVIDYDDDIKLGVFKEKEIEKKMEGALKNNEFKVYLQPKYKLSDEKIGGAEALVRWKSSTFDIIYPGTFIPVFERNGFITKLDMFMYTEVCKLLNKWLAQGINPPAVSVNFSRLHLRNERFVSELCEVADTFSIPRELLEIEITESTMLENEDVLLQVLDKLHAEHFIISMDDFGMGYSSLGLLKNIPVDVIKIDRSFFLSAHDNERAKAVLSNVIHMASDLHIHTVAEGVEESAHIDMLKTMGCDMVQGYYYAKPMPVDDFEKLIKGNI